LPIGGRPFFTLAALAANAGGIARLAFAGAAGAAAFFAINEAYLAAAGPQLQQRSLRKQPVSSCKPDAAHGLGWLHGGGWPLPAAGGNGARLAGLRSLRRLAWNVYVSE